MTTHEAAPLRVLVIEDDVDTQSNLRDILELDDHEVLIADSVTRAVTLPNLASISVIVLDRRLPDGNAEDLIPQLRQLAPEADVIVVTGHADVESAILALQRGAADYIIKPINPDVLRASLARSAKQIELRRDKERSEASFRDLIEAVDFMVIILDQNYRIRFANQFTTSLTGYSNDELLQQPLTIFLQAESLDKVYRQLRQLDAGLQATEQEFPIRCRNGDEKWVLWNLRTLNYFEGSRVLLTVGHDVTERRRLEQRALQSERLAAIGQMVTGLAHESRNALQRSQACLELLRDELHGQPEPLELVERIERAQHHLHHLYEEVRSYAAPIGLHRKSVPVNEVWRDTWAHLEIQRAPKQLLLREESSTNYLHCQVDPVALEQVFRNIFENAIFVSKPGDSITVRCSETSCHGTPALEIAISDQGPGLKPEQAKRIFEPFYTTKTQGTGLGMAITRRIVEAHGGTIRVNPEVPKGAEIVIVLPHEAD